MAQIDEKKQNILRHLKESKEMFVLYSRCTRMPYVHCDEDSYNDQIYLFRKEKDAKKTAEEFGEAGIPVQVLRFFNKEYLNFYSGLYFIGVNAMLVDREEEQIEIILSDLVLPPDYSKMPEGKIRVDNPEFQLTAMYLMQKLRRAPGIQPDEELRELEEELDANMRRGHYIVPILDENKQVPLMKLKEDHLFQPIFTDAHEFQKFRGKQDFRGAVVPYETLLTIISDQAKGFVINPMGVHVVVMKEQIQ